MALAFMAIFTVTLILWFFNPNMLKGVIGFLTLFCGAIGIGLFLVIKFIKTPEEKEELAKKSGNYLPTPINEPTSEKAVEVTDKSLETEKTIKQTAAKNTSEKVSDSKKTL